MENKRVYCHTTNFDYIEDTWYIIYNETDYSYVIQHVKYGLRKYLISEPFSDYFYTEQEFNRIKNLNELING